MGAPLQGSRLYLRRTPRYSFGGEPMFQSDSEPINRLRDPVRKEPPLLAGIIFIRDSCA